MEISFLGRILIFISCLSGIVVSGQKCPLYWTQHGSICYRFRYVNLMSWNDAENYCKQQTSHLVKFESVSERNWMYTRIRQIITSTHKPTLRFWTGLNNYNSSQSKYQWADSSPVDPRITAGQRISPSATNHCVKVEGNKLMNINCNTKLGYICERHIGIPLTCNADAGWQSFNNYCYKVYSDPRAVNTWDGAQKTCDNQGGNLFTAGTQAEEQIIHDFSKNTRKNYWIGARAYQQGNSYQWLSVPDNTPISTNLQFWVRTPRLNRNQYNSTCAAVIYNRNSPSIAWQPYPCNQRKNFVCKKAEGSCQPGWIAHQNRCYQFNTKFLLPWNQAKSFCQRQGARMVESYGNTATNFLNSYLDELRGASISSFWIGATDNKTNTYKWSIGAAIKYQHWVHNPPPNTPNRQDCVYIATSDRRGLWRTTVNCGLRKAFICTIPFGKVPKVVTTPRPTLRCDPRWILNSGMCFKFNDQRTNWQSAQQSCQRQGGQLATVSSNAIHSFIINRIRTQEYWFGLNDRAANRQYTWAADNSKLGRIRKWCPHEPNDAGAENCVEYRNRCWNDKSCLTSLKYICQKPPRSVPTGPPVTTTPVPFSLRCGPGWEEDPSSKFCYSFHDDQLAWDDARLACRRYGGNLASIHSREQQVYINTRAATMTSNALWLGGTDRSKEGGWTWADRTPFDYVNWAPRQPDDARHNEDCMGIYIGRVYQWNDFPCNYRNGFVCQKYWGRRTTIPPRSTPRKPAGQFLGCPTYWKKNVNSCWLFNYKNITADNARTTCQRMGGYLATVNSPQEQRFMAANIPRPLKGYTSGGQYWIGLSDRVSENSFVWDDGTKVAYTNWNVHEPNNWKNRDEDCVGVHLKTRGWNDATCGEIGQGYICKKGLSVVASTGQSPILQGCTSPYRGIGFQGMCYAIVDLQYARQQPRNFQSANQFCQQRYKGNLATVNDRYVSAFLSAYINHRKDYFWIGLTDQQSLGTYSWVNGQTDYFTNWYFTHSGNENNTCVAMRSDHPIGLWENKKCTESHNFICESPRTGFTNPPTTLPPTVPCPNGWAQYSSYCYKKYNVRAQKMTWTESRDYCRGIGGDLLSIHDKNELSFVTTSLLTDSTTYWIGLNDLVNETGYVWSDGLGTDYTNWAPGEPNNYHDEDCVQIVGYSTQKGKWNDNNCFLSLNFICKVKRGVTLSTTAATVTGSYSAQCGTGSWSMYNGSCYMVSPTYGANSSLSWYQAQQFCNANGANLASIHSRDENNLILGMISKLNRNEFWMGLNELEKPGTYKWNDGTVLDYVNWNDNEPNDAFGGERCGGIIAGSGAWNDDNCGEQIGFVCKKTPGSKGPATPSPPTLIQGGCSQAGFVPDPYGTKCFYAKNETTPMTWDAAVTFCRNFGTGYDIAAINNENQQAFVASLVQGFTTNVWIGLNNKRHHSRFLWQDNSPFLYVNWNSGEPNGRSSSSRTNTEECVEMYVKGVVLGFWNDNKCNVQRNVICQGPKAQGSATPSQRGTCRQGYVSHGTSCYKFVKTPVQNWQLANNLCQGDGGTLVTINSNYENYYVESQMGPNYNYWIGLQYNQYSKSFAWPNSWPVTYTRWGSAEPSTGPQDLCTTIRNGDWDNNDCSRQLGYVCEINSVQPPAPTPAPLGHCRNSDEVVNGDYCYYFSPFTKQSWPMARFTCNKRMMDLVSLTSADELNWVYTVMLNSRDQNGQHTQSNIWIGLTKGLYSGFVWSDGSGFDFANWNTGEPSDPVNATNEECVEMYRDNAKWNDIACTQSKAFVCKGQAVLGSSLPPSTTNAILTLGPSTAGPIGSTLTPGNPLQTTIQPVQTPSKGPVGPGIQTPPPIGFTTPRKVPPPTLKPGPSVPPPTGALSGQKDHYIGNRVLSTKKGLNGGALVGVLLTVVVILGVVGMIGILYWKKRNPAPMGRGGTGGFDNALYSKGNDKVNINNEDDDADA